MPIFAPGAPTYNSEGELIAGVSAEGLNLGFSVALATLGTIAELQAYTSAPTSGTVQTQCYILGHAATADGGEGVFSYDPADTTSADNGGTIIVDGLGRRWHRLTGGLLHDPKFFGAVGDGATDDTNAFNAVLLATPAPGVVSASNGSFKTSSLLINAANNAILSTGASYTVPGDIPGIVDGTVLGATPWVLHGDMTLAGTATAGTANQFLASFQAVSQATSALAPSEKGVVYVAGTQLDASNAPTIYRDLVGIESHMAAGGTNAQARIWGYHTTCTFPTGTDGLSIGVEVESANNGASPAGIGALTSPYQKIGFQATADGPNPSTYAINVVSGGGVWDYGLMVQPGSIPSGGFGAVFPAGVPIGFWNTANTAVLNMIYTSASAQLVLGSQASSIVANAEVLPYADNTLILGASGMRWTQVWAVNGTIQTSDPSLKTNIKALPYALPIIAKINPITFQWKVGGFDVIHDAAGEKVSTPRPGKRTHWGFNAEEIGAVFAEMNMDFGGYVVGEDGTKHIRPDQLLSVLWKANQELLAKVEALEAKVGIS